MIGFCSDAVDPPRHTSDRWLVNKNEVDDWLMNISYFEMTNVLNEVQVGKMGSVSACSGNNCFYVSCLQPALHCKGAPSGRGAT